MQALPQTSRAAVKSAVALVLTFAAGMVDIVGYIAVYKSFVAHMTGTTVHLGNKLATGAWGDALKAAVTIASFVAGSVVGRIIIETGARKKRTVASYIFLMEAGLVFLFILSSRLLHQGAPEGGQFGLVCALLFLLATAMGLQTAGLTRIGPLTIHTTFVTGMLNKFAQSISQWLFWVRHELRSHLGLGSVLRASRKQPSFRNAGLMSAIWLTYMMGSVAGTLMNAHWSTRSLYLVVVLILLAVGVDQVRPLSLEEEQEQV